MDAISWACEHEQGSKIESFFEYSFNVNRIFLKYFVTPRIKYLVMWKNIFPRLMDEQYLWMNMDLKNDNGWMFSWTFTTSFVLQKTKQKKHDTRNLCWFIVNNPSHEMLKLYLN
jgi:hypothetical protein